MFNSRDLQRLGKDLLDKAEAGELVRISRNGTVFELKLEGSEREDPEVQRLIKAIKMEVADIHSVVYDIQASLEAGEATEHMAVGLPENRSEATPQRKVAGGKEMACCRGNKPCKHWEFNGEVWRNTLSRRTREVS